jgi:hypothetical protein
MTLSRQAIQSRLFTRGVTNRLKLVLFSVDHHLTQIFPARMSWSACRRKYQGGLVPSVHCEILGKL